MDKKFNLLDEPWIKVLMTDGSTVEMSILETFKNASEILRISGETPSQDISVQRFLMAIMHVVVGRYTVEGKMQPLSQADDSAEAFSRWEEYWIEAGFPIEVVNKYLEEHRDRFYMIHPDTPFYQITEDDLPEWMKNAPGKSTYSTAKFCGELLESANKLRLFPSRSGKSKEKVSLSEAARWLLHLNAFDDAGFKTPLKGVSFTVGWPGKTGSIYAVGNNLFESLMLNLVLLSNGDLWEKENPIWESSKRTAERVADYLLPQNPSELLTMQSRRIFLLWEDDHVVGYRTFGGDQFSEEDAFSEQWTLWQKRARKGKAVYYTPKKTRENKQIWREFSSIVGASDRDSDAYRIPGVVSWIGELESRNKLDNRIIQFETLNAHYDSTSSSVVEIFTDRLSFHTSLLKNLESVWLSLIEREMEYTALLIDRLGILAMEIAQASGQSPGRNRSNWFNTADDVKEIAYDQLDLPFREWLESIDPNNESLSHEEKSDEWWEIGKETIRRLGSELVDQSSPAAFVGRKTDEEQPTVVSVPNAYRRFLINTSTRSSVQFKKRK